MRALVVYESMYGNTHVVAASIADGLWDTCDVTLVPVGAAWAGLVVAPPARAPTTGPGRRAGRRI
jgi:hypothetical protein